MSALSKGWSSMARLTKDQSMTSVLDRLSDETVDWLLIAGVTFLVAVFSVWHLL
jgi:hypothetical protein